jgi:adenosine kinase
MSFPGRFAEQLLPDQLDKVSVSFLVDDLDIRRGGVAANITFGMAALGQRPVLVGAVGADFGEYRSWLERHGVDCSHVKVSELRHTARFLCTTDRDQNQIASFYPGAMVEAREIELGPIVDSLGGVDLVVISPNDPEAMVRHTDECRDRGFAFVADPSQQLSGMEPEQIRRLVDGAAYLFSNSYERALLEQKTGWSGDDVLGRVGVRVTTMGAEGALVEQVGVEQIVVPVPPEERRADPTGVGDAFRAGFLTAVAWGLGHERAAQIGSMLATYVIETVGTQEYDLVSGRFVERFESAYGTAAAAELKAYLGPA